MCVFPPLLPTLFAPTVVGTRRLCPLNPIQHSFLSFLILIFLVVVVFVPFALENKSLSPHCLLVITAHVGLLSFSLLCASRQLNSIKVKTKTLGFKMHVIFGHHIDFFFPLNTFFFEGGGHRWALRDGTVSSVSWHSSNQSASVSSWSILNDRFSRS